MMKVIYIFGLIAQVYFVQCRREDKVLPLFQVVSFPNDICTGGSKNGTCYTTEECSNRGGKNDGSCAQGYGVCCTFTTGCGSSSSENCTYFEVSGANDGPCVGKICKCSSNICQIRLDLTTFAITGPSTLTDTVGKMIGGQVTDGVTTGKLFNYAGNCFTDSFTVSGAVGVPPLCGTLSGEHVYFDLTDDCHDLSFSFGQNAIGAAKESSRRFSVKVSQISCDSDYKAPPGCLQWLTGTSGAGTIQTFNYDNNIHLANQYQTICFRREQGNCRICFSADTITDVNVGGKGVKGVVKESSCCGYGADGMKTDGGADCILIPGAEKAVAPVTLSMGGACQGGGAKGLVTVTNGDTKTICSRVQPFQIAFKSDAFELAEADTEGLAAVVSKGFKLTYFQTTC